MFVYKYFQLKHLFIGKRKKLLWIYIRRVFFFLSCHIYYNVNDQISYSTFDDDEEEKKYVVKTMHRYSWRMFKYLAIKNNHLRVKRISIICCRVSLFKY